MSNMNLDQRREHLLDTVYDQDQRININVETLKNIKDKERKDEFNFQRYRHRLPCVSNT